MATPDRTLNFIASLAPKKAKVPDVADRNKAGTLPDDWEDESVVVQERGDAWEPPGDVDTSFPTPPPESVEARRERRRAYVAEHRARTGRYPDDGELALAGVIPMDPMEDTVLMEIAEPSAPVLPSRLGDTLESSIARAQRRADGHEKPIPLPFPILAPHFGGGLWPGLHTINANTGVGKTAIALQLGAHAAKAGVPVVYVGLELPRFDVDLRLIAGQANIPWSSLWRGDAGAGYMDRAREAIAALRDLPFHVVDAPPHGLSPSTLLSHFEAMRAGYPETDGPGSRPVLAIVDFLQLIGDEPDRPQELRVRIGAAAYALKHAATNLGFVVVPISSVARERYKLPTEIRSVAGIAWDEDADGCPINRRMLNPDAIVGIGKESGELEFSADTVSALVKVPETQDRSGVDVIFATAKGRATGATWSPLHFTGHRYEECSDRGGRMVAAWQEADAKRTKAKSERAAKKKTEAAAKKATELADDVEAVRQYIAAHPGCLVRDVRKEAVRDNSARWKEVVEALGDELDTTNGCRIVIGGEE